MSAPFHTLSGRDALAPPKRQLYMDFLRILACFLVIVNHTNSYVFKGEASINITWIASILWYYLSKTAVPLFVMVSGACLLPKQDSYRRMGQRLLRMLLVLLLFSYFYYLWDVWKTYWAWERAFDLVGFLRSIWRERITDSFWYLYFYMGLMLMLPLLQRMAKAMAKKDLQYLLCLSFGAGALWPLLTHYVPGLALPEHLDLTLLPALVGLFFAGHYLHAYVTPKPWHAWACSATLLLMAFLAMGLTALETTRVLPGEKYWFMDERTQPALPIVFSAMAIMLLAKGRFVSREAVGKAVSAKGANVLVSLGACSFAIYLLQDWLIAETRQHVFVSLCAAMNPFLAGLIWSAGVFAALLPVTLLLKRIPFLRKML